MEHPGTFSDQSMSDVKQTFCKFMATMITCSDYWPCDYFKNLVFRRLSTMLQELKVNDMEQIAAIQSEMLRNPAHN